jgi:hypothetical protein
LTRGISEFTNASFHPAKRTWLSEQCRERSTWPNTHRARKAKTEAFHDNHGTSSVDLDLGVGDDRPPLVDLCLQMAGERLLLSRTHAVSYPQGIGVPR